MSKYLPLWEYAAKADAFPFKLGFDEISAILGFDIDHSFLTYKKEAINYGIIVKKIFLKEKPCFSTGRKVAIVQDWFTMEKTVAKATVLELPGGLVRFCYAKPPATQHSCLRVR